MDSPRACRFPAGTAPPPPSSVACGDDPRARDPFALVPSIPAWRVACYSLVEDVLKHTWVTQHSCTLFPACSQRG